MAKLKRKSMRGAHVPSAACLVFALMQPQFFHTQQKPETTPKAPYRGSGTGSVNLTITITDSHNRPVKDLPREAFAVLEKDEPLEITHFSAADTAISVGILFDLSGSVAHRMRSRLKPVAEQLLRFIELGHNANEYFIEVFGSRFILVPDWTHDRSLLAAVLNELASKRIKGSTALFDALHAGFEKVLLGPHPKHVLILVSDGEDTSSKRRWQEIRPLVRQSDVAVYAIGIIDPADSSSEYGRNFLSELCDISGGLAFFPLSAAEVREALERIAVELRHQYSIEFRPSGSAADGKWRKVKIRVTPPLSQTGTSNPPKPMKIHVRSREGYVAPLSTK